MSEPQCKTSIECFRKLADVLELFNCSAEQCVREGYILCNNRKYSAHEIPRFVDPTMWKFAIGLVEGKPVFVGDVLYDTSGERHTASYTSSGVKMEFRGTTMWSWTPPKPKTVTIEYTLDEAERVLYSLKDYRVPIAAKSAIEKTTKALDDLK